MQGDVTIQSCPLHHLRTSGHTYCPERGEEMSLKLDLRYWHSIWWYNPPTYNNYYVWIKYKNYCSMQMGLFSGVKTWRGDKNGVSFHRTEHHTLVKLLETPLTHDYSRRKEILGNNGQAPYSEEDSHRREERRMRSHDFAYKHSLRFIYEPHVCGMDSEHNSKGLNRAELQTTAHRGWAWANSLTLRRLTTC